MVALPGASRERELGVPEVLMLGLPIRRHEPQFALLMISANAAWMLKDAAQTHSERTKAELITKQ